MQLVSTEQTGLGVYGLRFWEGLQFGSLLCSVEMVIRNALEMCGLLRSLVVIQSSLEFTVNSFAITLGSCPQESQTVSHGPIVVAVQVVHGL